MAAFPDEFLWGASTASHQVEGGTHNQWSEWEQHNADRLAREAPQTLSWLANIAAVRPQITDPENYISGSGVEHYTRFAEDFKIAAGLGLNAFRFSIEWSRIEPKEGTWNEAAIEHYRKYIHTMKDAGLEPVLTLWHWTMPTWFTVKGGFEKRRNIAFFERYTDKIAQEFGSQIQYVITLNEPNVYMSFGYMIGQWPPQKKRPLLGLRVYRNLTHAHNRAYAVLKASNPALKVGLAAQLADIRPKQAGSRLNRAVVRIMTYAVNWWFLDRIRRQLDYIGINYYFTEYRDTAGHLRNPEKPLSDLGWYMEPGGIGAIIRHTWQRYHLPILITENGVADSNDNWRQWWLEETLAALVSVQTDGIPLIGYLHWSLLDNFEWAYGWWPKFGLISVDRKTMRRTVRPSARWLADYIKQH